MVTTTATRHQPLGLRLPLLAVVALALGPPLLVPGAAAAECDAAGCGFKTVLQCPSFRRVSRGEGGALVLRPDHLDARARLVMRYEDRSEMFNPDRITTAAGGHRKRGFGNNEFLAGATLFEVEGTDGKSVAAGLGVSGAMKISPIASTCADALKFSGGFGTWPWSQRLMVDGEVEGPVSRREAGELMNYDDVKAALAKDARGNVVACCTLQPPLPIIPMSWQATIEASFNHRKYSMHRNEFYDHLNQVVRIEHFDHELAVVQIHDFVKNKTFHVRRPTEVGAAPTCEEHQLKNFMVWAYERNADAEQHLLKHGAAFLNYTSWDPKSETYLPGYRKVRGVPVERWQHEVEMRGNRYNVTYSFGDAAWLERKHPDVHRPLRRIEVEGMRDGELRKNTYDFVNMQPLDVDKRLYNPCEVYEGIKGCGCEKRVDMHVGEIVGIALGLFFGGVLLTVATFFLVRCCRNRKRSKFVEMHDIPEAAAVENGATAI